MNNEIDFISKAQQGDVHSFNSLVLHYQDMAFSVAYRIMQEQHSASDATQDAFISAFQKLHQFNGQNFKAWLMRIVTNTCYDELRRRKRRPTSSLDGLVEEAGDSLPFSSEDDMHLMASIEGPESVVQRTELQSAVEECIRGLNETYRLIVVLADVEDYSYEEVSQLADISLGTVKSRLSRARARLRDCLRQKEELLPGQYRLSNK